MEINKTHRQESTSESTERLIEVALTDGTAETDNMISSEQERRRQSMPTYNPLKLYSSLPPQHPIKFLGLCAQVFVYYLGYGYLQELLFTLEGFKDTSWFLSCYQFFVYSVLAFFRMGIIGINERRVGYRVYLTLAALTVGTMGLSNHSVGYLNYPTQVMFKCCKLIPVLIGGIIIQQKKFNRYDVLAAFCMSIGLVFFTLADSKVQPSFNLYGVTVICSALVADAIIGNYQEKIMKAHHVPNVEIVFFSFMFGFCFILIGLIVTNHLFSSIAFWNQNPSSTYGYALLFSVFGYLGIDVVLTLIKEYGALICVTVTTCRKAITIVLSFTLFSKPFVFDYVWSGLIVVVGIYLNVYSRNQAAFDARIISLINKLHEYRLWPKFLTPTPSRPLPI